MCLKASSEFSQLESWLLILIGTYQDHPSGSLAKIINYYLGLLLHHDDIHFCPQKRGDYLVMHKFWAWQSGY